MKLKHLIIVSLILAVLTIGAVSAADDVASDDLAVDDDAVDVIADPVDPEDDGSGEEGGNDGPDEEILINEEPISQDTDNVFDVVAKNDTEYSIVVALKEAGENGRDRNLNEFESSEITNKSVDENDPDFTVYHFALGDLNFTEVKDGDTLVFKLFTADLITSSEAIYHYNDGVITLEEIYGDDNGDEGDEGYQIDVSDVVYDEFDKTFAVVTVPEKSGIFAIYAEGDDDDVLIFKEDLNKTNRVYETDENGYYIFNFTFNDVNNYIANNIDGADSFKDLVDQEIIVDESEIYFVIEDVDEEEPSLYESTWIISINPDAYVFDPAEEEEEDIVNYGDLDVIMYDDDEWKNELLLDIKVEKGLNATIFIYLNDNETAAYEKKLSDLTPVYDESEENIVYYNVTVGDLNIDEAGEYVLKVYLKDGENTIWQYDDEEPEILILYEAQIAGNENATIEVTPLTTVIGDDALVFIDAENNESDVVIYVDGGETPITKPLNSFNQDEYGIYIITAKDLNLDVGKHDLNITYMGVNLIATADVISNVEIELPSDDDVIATGDDFTSDFVSIRLVDGEIFEAVSGTINVTIYNENRDIVGTMQKDIKSLYYNDDPRAYVVCVSDFASDLNGTYNVTVRYFNGNEASTEESSWVNFRLFNPADYGTAIKNTVKDENDYVITLTELPPADVVLVKIDGNKTVEIDEWHLFHQFNEDENVYYIKLSELKGLDDGSHSIVVGIEVNDTFKQLASGNVIIDLEENIDLNLTISVANISEGENAVIVITANKSFTGNILVQIGNSNYTVAVDKGQGSLPVTGLAANNYTAIASFVSDGVFKSSTKNTTFTVKAKQVTPVTPAKKADVIKLTLKKVKIKKSAKKLVLQATLKINGKAAAKKTIKFKFKGKTYKAKTNKKGVAKVTIKKKVLKKLKVGKKVKYTATYGKKTVKRTVKVKK